MTYPPSLLASDQNPDDGPPDRGRRHSIRVIRMDHVSRGVRETPPAGAPRFVCTTCLSSSRGVAVFPFAPGSAGAGVVSASGRVLGRVQAHDLRRRMLA